MPKGLKINNQQSSIQPPKPNHTQAFEQAAGEAVDRINDYKQRSFDLGTKFKALIEDRTLADNKSVLSKDLEQEVLNKLSVLSTEINADIAQPDGMGSTALCVLLMKMTLLQRNRINAQAYQLEQLEKRLAKLESK